MAKTYHINKQSDIRRFTHDMAKIAAQKAESIKSEFTFPTNLSENYSTFYKRPQANFPYYSTNENLLYNLHRIKCPKCFKDIGVKIRVNHCAWCDCQIEVDENYPFLD